MLQYLNRKLLRFACCKYYPAARRAKLRKQLCNARINLVFEFSAVGKPVAIIVECKFCLFIVKAVICFERIHKRQPDKAEELRSVRNTDAEFFQCIHHRVCDAERRIGQRAVKVKQNIFIFCSRFFHLISVSVSDFHVLRRSRLVTA